MPTSTKTVKGVMYLYFVYYDSLAKGEKEIYCGPESDPKSKEMAEELEKKYLEGKIIPGEPIPREIKEKIVYEIRWLLPFLAFLLLLGIVLPLVLPSNPALFILSGAILIVGIWFFITLLPMLRDWRRPSLMIEGNVVSKWEGRTDDSPSYTVRLAPDILEIGRQELSEFNIDYDHYVNLKRGDKVQLTYHPETKIIEQVRKIPAVAPSEKE